MENEIECNVPLIMKTVGRLFEINKLPIFTESQLELQPQYQATLSRDWKIKFQLDEDIIYKRLAAIKWAVAETQFECGYLLIAKNSLEFKKFAKKNKAKSETEHSKLYIEYYYFKHHYFMSLECLYRIHERISKLLDYIFIHESDQKNYLNNVIDKLREKKIILNKQEFTPWTTLKKRWNKIASMRNIVSHQNSNLVSEYKLEIQQSLICDMHGLPISTYTETLPDINKDLSYIVNSFKKCSEDIKYVLDFIKNKKYSI